MREVLSVGIVVLLALAACTAAPTATLPPPTPTPTGTPTPTPTATPVPAPLRLEWAPVQIDQEECRSARFGTTFTRDTHKPNIIIARHVRGAGPEDVCKSEDLGQTWQYMGAPRLADSFDCDGTRVRVLERRDIPRLPRPTQTDVAGRVWHTTVDEGDCAFYLEGVLPDGQLGFVAPQPGLVWELGPPPDMVGIVPDWSWRHVLDSPESGWPRSYRLEESLDGGSSWRTAGSLQIEQGPTSVNRSPGVASLIVDATQESVAYLLVDIASGLGGRPPGGDPTPVQVIRTTDEGQTWEPLPLAPSDGQAQALYLPVGQPGLMYIAVGNNLWESPDRGETWTPVVHVEDRCPFCHGYQEYWVNDGSAVAWGGFWADYPWAKQDDRYPLPQSSLPSPINPQRVTYSVDRHDFDVLAMTTVDGPHFAPRWWTIVGRQPRFENVLPFVEQERFEYVFSSRIFLSGNGGDSWREIAVPPPNEAEAWEWSLPWDETLTYTVRGGMNATEVLVAKDEDRFVVLAAFDFGTGSERTGMWRSVIPRAELP